MTTQTRSPEPHSPEQVGERFSRSTELATIDLTATDGHLLAPLDSHVRRFTLGRLLDEVADDVSQLHEASRRGVHGARRSAIGPRLDSARPRADGTELLISGQEVMQAWEQPLMDELSRLTARAGGDVLEVGFGMGISASSLQKLGVRSHTIIEANPEIAASARTWAEAHAGPITVVEGRWQEVIDSLGSFDAILFDTYPTTETEYREHVLRDAAYVQHFLPSAAARLAPSGVLAYYTMEIDSLSRRHQRALLEHFSSFEVGVVSGLEPPADCTYWWADSMATVVAHR